MKRIYVRKPGEIAGHVFKCKTSVLNDTVKILPFTLVLLGVLQESDWANDSQTIADKYDLYVSETNIDGRSKLAKNLQYFSWRTVLTMKANKSF